MSGLVILLGMLILAVGLLWLSGTRGPTLIAATAVLFVGAAGYALQGSPGLAGSPRAGQAQAAPLPLDKAREIFMGRFNVSDRYFVLSDSFARRGDTLQAVGAMKAGIKQFPRDYQMWVGLGNALADHAQGITPAARLAFARAKELVPNAPAPDYFLGLALLRSGEAEEAERIWKDLLARTPPDAPWRAFIAEGLQLIEQMRGAPPMTRPASR